MKQTLHDIKSLFLALVFLLSFNFGWGQTPNGTLDFGNPTDGTVATTGNTGFGGVRVGTGGGGFTLKNPGQSIGNLGELRGIAPTGGSINSVGITSDQYGTSSNVFTIAFDLYLSGGSSGTWYFFAGNGDSFGSAQTSAFSGADVFTGLRWTFGASSSITTVNRSAGSWGSITGTPFSQNTAYKVIIVGNNSNSTVNYGSNSVGAYKYDLWINGVLAGDDLAKALIGNNTNINAFRFYGENSTSNVAELALDNVVWYNSAVNLLVPTPTITTTGTLTSLNTTYGTASSTTSFNVSGANMEAGISINPPSGFEISTTADFSSNVGSNGAPITVGSAGTIASTTIYVRLSATANAGTYSGNIVLSSTNATSKNVATASSTINKVTPTILTTPTATAIFYEQSLSNSSLSGGSASVPGSFSFTNPTFVPTAVGVYGASVTFTPTNTTNYNIVTTTVNVTVNPPVDPTIYINGSSLNFSSLCINTSSVTQTYSVSALSLTNNLIISAPTHFQIKTGAGAWGTSISLTPSSGSISSTTIEVRFLPTATGVFTSNITHSTTGGVTKNVIVSGEGIDTPPAIGNPSSTSGATTATLGGNITALGCSTTITTIGIEYSTTNGFANGAGTIVSESVTFTTGTFTINVSSLTPNTTYYFKAFATSASGTTYTSQGTFTTLKGEPTNHPTDFRPTGVTSSIIVQNWTASVAGLQAPDGYLVKAANASVVDPVDGVDPVVDVVNIGGNGTASRKITPGSVTTSATFTGMSSGTMYYYKIYPYTNSGSNINYKIAGAPSFNHATLPTTPTAFSASGLVANAASISWSQGAYNAGVETLVFVKAGSAITNGTPNSNPATYTGNAVFGSGTPYFNDAAAYCVYKGDAASINVSGLTGNTTYHVTVLKVVENANSDGTYSYSTALTGSFTTPTIAAPVATAATSLGSSSFVANWNAVPGATGYVIDVSTTPFELLDIVGWNFPNDDDNNVADTGITENELKVLTTVGGTSNPDYINVSSPLSDTSVALATGWNGGSNIKYWQVEFSTLGYNQLKLSSVQRSSNTGPKNFKAQYKVGTSGTWTDIPGATSITLANDWTTGVLTNVLLPVECNNQSSLYIRWIMTTNDAVTGGNVQSTGTSSIDNIYIRADFTPNYVQPYQDYPVGNVTSFEVTGLDPNTTYYYIVRAIDATTETPNSNQIQVQTTQDIAVADFRSRITGDYDTAATWEYDSGVTALGWVIATVPPSGNNNVLIQAPHTVTMTDEVTFNLGKTLTVNGKLLTSTYTITGAGGITVPSGGVVASALSITDTDTFSSSLAVSGTIDFQTGSTFELNGTAKQYLGARPFSNLKISNTAGVKAKGDLTVNGELSLAANPNDTDGSLDMVINYGTYATNPYGTGDYANSTLAFNNLNSHILLMGPNSTTIGPGDVTGKIRRTTIADNTTYTFGNVNTQLRFTSVSGSALPTQITVVATRGDHGTHIDNTGGVLINGYTANRNTLKRMYQFLRTGGSTNSRFTLRMAYQDAELNGNTNESNLVTWDHHIPYGGRTPHEHGKTSFDPTGNWVELSNHSVSYLATEGDIAFTKYWMLSTKETISDYVWTGAVSSSWNILSNWSGGKVPNDTADVLIPDAAITNNDPVITTASGYGILYPLPTFIAGEVRMRSLEIATGGLLTVEDGQAAKITIYGGPNAAGGGINYGSWDNKGTFNPGNSKVIFDYDATASESTISGTTQFYDVEIATGKKATVQSDTQISISNTLVNNGTFNAALLPNTITYNGTTAQTVLPTTYYNLTIANGVSATLGGNATTLNTLTLSDKFLTTGSYKMTMGISGVVSRTTGFVKGTLEKPLTAAPSLFEVGDTFYAPVTVSSTGLTGEVLMAAKPTTGNALGSVLNQTAKSNVYWNLSKSGTGSITDYTASFDIANATNEGQINRYRIAHYPGSSWNILPYPTISNDTTFTSPSLTTFGDFELGEVKKTIWRQTGWDPLAPDVYTDAEIDWPYTTASNGGGFSSNSLVINSGQSLEITDGFSVTVANEIINNSSASSVTVENNANLIQLNDGINTGAITAKRNSAPMIRLDYTFWSSPVLGQNVYAFSPLTLVNRIYLFSTPINYYTTNGLSSLTTFAPGVAYVIRAPNNYSSSTPTEYNGIFTGVPNNGNYTFTLNTSSLGYNGVGNPYPSTINATSFVNDNSSVIDGTLYFFAHTGTGEEAGQFALWNLSGGTAAASAPNSPGTTVAPNGTIQVGQGFIVKSLPTGGSLVFKNTQRIHDAQNQFYRSNSIPSVSNASVIERHRMWLNLSKIESSGAARMMNQMMVAYVSGATNDVDRGFDGLSYTSSGTLLASRLNGKNYSIQGRALPFTSTDVVPLVFKTTTVGTFEINLSNVDGLFTSASQPVYLYDKTLGRYHNLKTTPYRFTSEEGTFDLRFELVYPNMTLGINDSGLTTSVVYVSNDVLHIESLTEAIEEVRIFDLAGRLLLDKYQLNTLAFSADKLPFRDVVLLVQFKTVSGAVITRKVKF